MDIKHIIKILVLVKFKKPFQRNMVKHELRVRSSELRVTGY